MAIIIKDMDEPKYCYNCPFNHTDVYTAHNICTITGKEIFTLKVALDTGKAKMCPIKSVEEMLSGLSHLKQEEAVGSIEHMSAIAFNAGISKAIEYIKEYCEVEEWEGNEDE